jgi:hypothetical protein
MGVNKKVIVAVFVIGGSGIVNAAVNKTAVTPVILGSYIFLLVLSVMDLFGGGASQLAGALAMLAMVGILLTEFPWGTILGLAGVNTKQGSVNPLPGARSQN